jgi:hypothetical protein
MRRRLVFFAPVVAVGLALAGGIAYATIPDSSGIIHGCRNNASGLLRAIDSPSQSCTSGESQLDWVQATAFDAFIGPFNGVGGNIEITSTSFGTPTHVLTLNLPAGAFVLSAQVIAAKADGKERLICSTGEDQDIQLRPALGTDPGYTIWATVSGTRTLSLATATAVELVCVQQNMTGSDAVVLSADLTATRVGGITAGPGS